MKLLFIYQIVGKYISCLVNSCFKNKNKKKILLYSKSPTMEEYLLNYLKIVEKVDKYEFYICFGHEYPNGRKQLLKDTQFKEKNVIELHHDWQLFCRKWDLIVCADLEYPFRLKKGSIPLLHIKHGFSIISYDDGKKTYAYGDDCFDENGSFMFDVMLEPDLSVAKAMWEKGEEYKEKIYFTGYQPSEMLLKEAENKEMYKKSLGISDGKTVVSFWGSWQKDSLFHVLDKALFDECDRLKQDYMFIFSIHPNEYRIYDKSIEPMGTYVDAQKEKGFLIRSPQENWIPYMMASDIVVADYTTMTALALLVGKKVVMSYFPDQRIWRESLYYKMKHILPVIHKAEELEDILIRALNDESSDIFSNEYRKNLFVPYEKYKEEIKNVTSRLIQEK